MNLKSIFLWLWRNSTPCRLYITLSSLLGMLSVVLSLLFVWFTKDLIDCAVAGQELTRGVVVVGVVMLSQLFVGVVWERVDVSSDLKLSNSLRGRLFDHAVHSVWSGRERFHSADVVDRLDKDVALVSGIISRTIPQFVVSVLQLAASFWMVRLFSVELAWVLVVIMPIVLLASKSYMGRMRRVNHNVRGSQSELQSHMQEYFQHRTSLSDAEQRGASVSRLFSLQQLLGGYITTRSRYQLFSRGVVQFGFAVGYLVAFVWGAVGLRDGVVSFGVMMAFVQLVGQLQRPVVALGQHLSSVVNGLASVDRLSQVESLEREKSGGDRVIDGGVGIMLKSLSFGYYDSKSLVLEDLDFDFKPRQMSAIVGQTGAGKSTIVRLIISLLTPTKGVVELYNDSGDRVESSPSTRCNIIYIPQGNSLMSGTIRDNLYLGCANSTDEQMWQALHVAAADFVHDLPAGLSTICGEGGEGLSEGQAQRISIARALLKSGEVLILDEPTSSLDSDTSEVLIQRLSEYAINKTIIIVTHSGQIADYCHQKLLLK